MSKGYRNRAQKQEKSPPIKGAGVDLPDNVGQSPSTSGARPNSNPLPSHHPSLCNNVTEGTEGTDGTQGTDGSERKRKEETSPAAEKVEPHLNYRFFLQQAKERNLKTVLMIAAPAEAAKLKVSPEFHFARLLRTADNALTDGKQWVKPRCFEEWYQHYEKQLNALMPTKDKEARLFEFLAACGTISLGYGETPLSRAGAKAMKTKPPKELEGVQNQKLNLLACFCRELALADEFNTGKFFLSCRDAAAIFESEDAMLGHRLLGALVGMNVLKVAKMGTRGENGKATRFKYIASDWTGERE